MFVYNTKLYNIEIYSNLLLSGLLDMLLFMISALTNR